MTLDRSRSLSLRATRVPLWRKAKVHFDFIIRPLLHCSFHEVHPERACPALSDWQKETAKYATLLFILHSLWRLMFVAEEAGAPFPFDELPVEIQLEVFQAA